MRWLGQPQEEGKDNIKWAKSGKGEDRQNLKTVLAAEWKEKPEWDKKNPKQPDVISLP